MTSTEEKLSQDEWKTDKTNVNNLSKKLTTLNVNAVEFVPNFESHASATAPASMQPDIRVMTQDFSDIKNDEVSADGGGLPVVTETERIGCAEERNEKVVISDNVDKSKFSVQPKDDSKGISVISEDWETALDSGKLGSPLKSSSIEDECGEDEEVEVDNSLTELDKPNKKNKNKSSVPSQDSLKKEHVNLVIIGHVDAGKSTIGGQIMALTGMVDKRTLDKYEREAKERSRESWYLSWALDTNQEEREKGKTVEVGRAYFETEAKHFTILDAPGHKSFVPNMIGGTAQADIAVLVISARKGEFETGFDRGGQTREHAMLAKTVGVTHMIVLINKMDEPTVQWSHERYLECQNKIIPYLKKLSFILGKNLFFMPVSGQTGLGLLEPLPEDICPWYRGPSFIQVLDQLPALNRKKDAPFLMPIIDKYRDMGTFVMGKVEAGEAKKGQTLLLMPNKTVVTVDQLFCDDDEVNTVSPGENVKAKLKAMEEEEISPGFVLCDIQSPVSIGKIFDAQVVLVELKSIICPGYSSMMHIHCAVERVEIKTFICLVDKKTGEKLKGPPRFAKQDQIVIVRFECTGPTCMEKFKDFPQMGRFTLRDEGKTIGFGKVLRIVE